MRDHLANIFWERDLEDSFFRILLKGGLRKLRELLPPKEEGEDEDKEE